MIVKRKELIENLKKAMPGIESGSATLQGADSFVFHNGKIYTYNDLISVVVPIESDELLSEGLEGSVKADEFFKIINKFSSDEMKLSVTEKGTWLIKCGKAKVEMSLMDFDFESRFENLSPDEDSWVDLNDEFISGIQVCKMNLNKTDFSGIYFEGKDIVSTDGNQLNFYTMKKTELPKFWLSDNSVGELLKLNKLVAIQLSGTWVHFKTEDGTIFSVKTLEFAGYPYDKLKNIINSSSSKKAKIHAKFPESLFTAIDRASSFSIDVLDYSAVRLSISKDKIEVSSERSSGKYTEKVAWDEVIENDFDSFNFYVDSAMMQYISKRTVEFYLFEGPIRDGRQLPRLLFVTENSKHLICTLSVDE